MNRRGPFSIQRSSSMSGGHLPMHWTHAVGDGIARGILFTFNQCVARLVDRPCLVSPSFRDSTSTKVAGKEFRAIVLHRMPSTLKSFWATQKLRPRNPCIVPLAQSCSLLLEGQRGTANSVDYEEDRYLDAVGDLDERNAAIHAVVLSIKGHCPRNLSVASPLA